VAENQPETVDAGPRKRVELNIVNLAGFCLTEAAKIGIFPSIKTSDVTASFLRNALGAIDRLRF
jgi:hypothetical protein